MTGSAHDSPLSLDSLPSILEDLACKLDHL
jgi:hypothetical protein